ncbi:HCO3 transporter family-domain-containing protein [Vararia minispora EC-137]|uniref:HCO3 transporter family-domain-containing protein n=1 Tax=Vararia minispora EC-137 TaxID=1314806 RepID=A0ACB8QSC8_9AGAM|nr:HCO3 transporter family-domain-containing protein [Vararia minispora EC-137]
MTSCLAAFAWLGPGRGLYRDLRARAPWYASDWRDAYNYRVVPAVVLIFFANVLPGIAFSLDLIETTNQYGVAEVLLSSFIAAFVFSVFGAQPLCIAGVTGPITVLNKTIYDIIVQGNHDAPDYLQFVGWVYMWAAILHWITAVFNACNFLRYVTLFSCDTFGFYVSFVYLEYGIQVLTRQLSNASTTAEGILSSLVLALLMLGTALLFRTLSLSPLFHRHVRRIFADYGMPISLVAASACAYWGLLNRADPLTLPTSRAFLPANDRPWLVRFWDLPARWVGIAFPFGLVLWILFFFDHNVSSLMAQGAEFPLRKPPGFHWDFFLLGITTFIAGLLGVPAPNGLIPQAPIHTTSLVIRGMPTRRRDDEERPFPSGTTTGTVTPGEPSSSTSDEKKNRDDQTARVDDSDRWKEVPIGVVEQRASNLAQGALCLVLLTRPFLHVLSLIPRGVLSGLFWYMALDALAANGITRKILFLLSDRTLTPATDPLRRVRKSRIVLFVGVQLAGFGATYAVTQTIAAIGFPVIILFLLPLRTFVVPRLPFTPAELLILDGPTASPFTMESVGGGAY